MLILGSMRKDLKTSSSWSGRNRTQRQSLSSSRIWWFRNCARSKSAAWFSSIVQCHSSSRSPVVRALTSTIVTVWEGTIGSIVTCQRHTGTRMQGPVARAMCTCGRRRSVISSQSYSGSTYRFYSSSSTPYVSVFILVIFTQCNYKVPFTKLARTVEMFAAGASVASWFVTCHCKRMIWWRITQSRTCIASWRWHTRITARDWRFGPATRWHRHCQVTSCTSFYPWWWRWSCGSRQTRISIIWCEILSIRPINQSATVSPHFYCK